MERVNHVDQGEHHNNFPQKKKEKTKQLQEGERGRRSNADIGNTGYVARKSPPQESKGYQNHHNSQGRQDRLSCSRPISGRRQGREEKANQRTRDVGKGQVKEIRQKEVTW